MKSSFPESVYDVDSVFKGIEIFSCEVCDGKVHCEFVLGQSITVKVRSMVRDSGGSVLGCMCGVKIRGRRNYVGWIWSTKLINRNV